MMAARHAGTYLKELGLGRHPFPVAPDDENLYLSTHIEQVIAEIVHGILARKGFMVLSGDVGLGKTTITRRVLKILAENDVHTSLVFHTSLKDVDLLREINRDFGLQLDNPPAAADQVGNQLKRLYDFLTTQYRQGKNCAIIIDDAQNLDRSSLELVRMISNLETDQQKLVQILLVGQPELMATLNTHALRQLRSRILIRKAARPLNRDELRNYILFKLSLAGNQGGITVVNGAFRWLYHFTKGNFRQLNVLMDRCLYVICRDGSKEITGRSVKIAHADLYPEKQHLRKRVVALAASLLLPLVIGAGSWLAHLQTSRTVLANASPAYHYYKVPQPLMTQPAHKQAWPQKEHTTPMPDPAVVAFLRFYGLDRYTAEFGRAFKTSNLAPVAGRIYQETGYQLVKLPVLPEPIRRRYGVLALMEANDQMPTWLLFWQPRLTLSRFYYQYEGKEIYRLQQMLAHEEFYKHKLDGIVGTRLMKAIIAFQQKWGLPVTGFPDEATVFMLCHQQKDSSQWPRG